MPMASRRTTWAIAASALAHLGVLVAALLQHPTLSAPAPDFAGPPQTIMPVLIMPRSRRSPDSGGPLSGGSQRYHLDRATPPGEPLPATRGAAARVPQIPAQPALPSALAQDQPEPGLAAPDLRAALRHGALGCANLTAVGLTRAEREDCQDQLARGVGQAPVLGIPLEPRIRAYYNAVALAKTRDPPAVPPVNRACIPGDPPPQRPGADHIPLIGCVVPFGPGEKPKLPSHWLTLGPCFIAPPKGPLTVEADITPP
jgi:hypothetical protein